MSDLISANPTGFSAIKQIQNEHETCAVSLRNKIRHFDRTPNGRGLLAISEGGEIGVWSKEQVGKPIRGQAPRKSLAGQGQWTHETEPLQSAIFAKGRAILLYSRPGDSPEITLQHLDTEIRGSRPPVRLPSFALEEGDDVAILLAVSDIDDGQSARGRRTQRALALAVSQAGKVWCWRMTSRYQSTVDSEAGFKDEEPEIELLHTYRLPVHGGSKPAWVLPVDPMGWHTSVIDWRTGQLLQDMVLTISQEGVLEYWQPRFGQHLTLDSSETRSAGENLTLDEGRSVPTPGSQTAWMRSGHVDTGRREVCMARCSSRKKTVLGKQS